MPNRLNELLDLFDASSPEANLDCLHGAVRSTPLSPTDQQSYIQLLDFARALQAQQPIFEGAYRLLLHLYVLNGSRLEALARIDRRLRGVAAGQSSLILISGIAGIGKTSLALACQERIEQLGGAFIATGCDEQASAPYGLWQAVVRSAAHVLDQAAAPLPAPIGSGPTALSSAHLKQALAAWLSACAAIRPLVIFIDDLHWADADSLELLNGLVPLAAQQPIVFMAAYRSEETQRGQALYDYLPKLQRAQQIDRLPLRPLTQADTVQLVRGFQGADHSELAAYLYQRAEGHPLFTLELLQDLAEQGWPQAAAGQPWLLPEHGLPVPIALQYVIMQRVARLGQDVEALLAVAAVSGNAWGLKLVEHLLGWPEERLLNALDRAVRADVVRALDENAETYRFSHGLIQEALYQAQLARRRKHVHAQIAACLDGGADLTGLAYHYRQAEHWERASYWCRAAGDEARRRFAIHSALGFYQQALAAAQTGGAGIGPEVQIECYERLGEMHMILDQRTEAESAYSLMHDLASRAEARVAEARALAHLSYVRVGLYQLDLGEKTALQAIALAEGSQQPRLLAQAYTSLGRVHMLRGDLDQMHHDLDQAAQSLPAAGDSALLSFNARARAYAAVWQGRYAQGEQLAQQALEHARATGDYLPLAGGHQMLSYAQIERGEYAAALKTIQSIMPSLDPDMGTHHQHARILNQVGYLHLELGDAAGALSWDQRALEASHSAAGKSTYEAERYSLLNLATDCLALGQVERALEYVTAFEAIKDLYEYGYFRYFNRYQLVLAEIHLAQRQFEQALHQAREARSLAEVRDIRKNIAKSRFYEGQALLELGQRQEGVACMQQAIAIVDQIQHGSLPWKLRYSLAKAYAGLGMANGDLLDEAWTRVAAITRQLGGTELQPLFIQSPLVQALHQEIPFAPPILAVKPSYPAGLTVREVEVLRLVAGGATNRQVAKTLDISVRTVNTHVTHILTKINCDNRTAASAFAIQHKLVTPA